MARDLSCASAKRAYKTKRDAQRAHPGQPVKRCDRCRWWHAADRRRRTGGARK